MTARIRPTLLSAAVAGSSTTTEPELDIAMVVLSTISDTKINQDPVSWFVNGLQMDPVHRPSGMV